MSNETNLTVRGRLTTEPELRFTPSGAGVVNFTLASQASKFDKNSNEWKDQPTKFWRCAAWNQGKLTRAENIANMLKKGDSIIVYGELTTREYETKEGEKRSADEIRVESIGKDLTFHGQAYAANERTENAITEDPWATPGVSNAGGWGKGPADTEPPF
jgi:single-strand DNA-binding protein